MEKANNYQKGPSQSARSVHYLLNLVKAQRESQGNRCEGDHTQDPVDQVRRVALHLPSETDFDEGNRADAQQKLQADEQGGVAKGPDA